MINNKTFLAIIPARGGSKRLLNKNILELAGKPLISWTIDAATKSKYIDKVMVTTDADEIMAIAKKYGAEVPFKRPYELSNDTAIRPDIIKHTIKYYSEEKQLRFDYIIFLQPTSPLRNENHIDDAIEYMFDKNADAVVSVCEVEHPVQWSGVLPENKNISVFLNDLDVKTRSQDLTVHYRLNGAIFICDVNKFNAAGCLFLKENIFAYEMPQNVSVDIDTETDFLLAKVLIENKI
ncbi:MAG TPA: acylneuraminate cytidylyltransferase family protein [Thioploca sp.]|nr:acylneuraminate cytidylyltransferase family protein [Thioploca sp.]